MERAPSWRKTEEDRKPSYGRQGGSRWSKGKSTSKSILPPLGRKGLKAEPELATKKETAERPSYPLRYRNRAAGGLFGAKRRRQ